MNSVFYALLFFTFLWIPIQTAGQIAESGSAQLWCLPERYNPSLSEGRNIELNVYEPYGVSNIISFDAVLSLWNTSSLRRCRYSFIGIPGYRKHSISGEFALELTDNLFVSQGLELGLLESLSIHPPSFLIASKNILKYSLSDSQRMFFTLDNWMSLLWPDTPFVPNCQMSLAYLQKISENVDIRAAYRFLSGSRNQVLAAISYSVSNKHELFLSFNLSPFELALGYAVRFNHLSFKVLLEQSPVFGQSPYTSIRWDL